MNKSYNSKLDVSSHLIPQQPQISLKQVQNDVVFDPKKILHEISTQQDISIPQLQSEMKQMKMNLNQLILELARVKKDISARPTVNSMMQNTILVTSMIQADPNIMKLLKSRQDQIKNQKIKEKQQNQSQKTTNNNQLKQLSYKLGNKLSNVNDGLSILYTIFKQLQKNSLIQIAQLRSFLEQKTHSIQDQINLMKIQQISQRTSMVEKVQAQFQTTQQKIRSIETKHTWQIKQLKNKLHQKLDKSIFQQAIEQTLQESKKMFKDFCQSSSQLINPQKIEQIQSTIKQNKQKFIKDITECHLKVDSITDRMTSQLVGVEFYRKQRTSIQKRLSNINMNFSQVHQKVSHLIKDSTDHQSRISKLQLQMEEKTKTMKEMRATLRSLSITEQFQQMLSQIDPQKILSFQNKINSLQTQNKQVYKMFGHVNEEIDKINSKFDIAGVLVPNQSRQKNYELNDLRQIIDQYFVQNRFANKISKLQSDINEGKASVQAIKLLEKKLSRLQKQSQYNKIIQQFNLLQQKISKEMKILTQKLQTRISQVQVQKSYIEGLITSTAKNKHFNNNNIDESQHMRRKLLMSESRSRLADRESNLYQRSSSMRKISSWETNSNLGMNKNVLNNSRIGKNTISSARKNLLLSNNLFLGN